MTKPEYSVRQLTGTDTDAIYALAVGNPLYYRHCPPFVTRESIAEDMQALPPGTTYDNKHYIGFFHGVELIAVMDLILGYPTPTTAFIGFFMVDKARQGCGTGSAIITECAAHFKNLGYDRIRLGYVKGNPQSEAFWKKNSFKNTGFESKQEKYTIVVMERSL